MKGPRKEVIEICLFLLVVNLPFLTVAQTVGLDNFLDSFERPDSYLYIDSGDKTSTINKILPDAGVVIIQKSSNPEYKVNEGDSIIYYNDNGDMVCNTVFHIGCMGTIKKYRTVYIGDQDKGNAVYENQIIGKIVGVANCNPWMDLSIKIWDASIHEFNINIVISK